MRLFKTCNIIAMKLLLLLPNIAVLAIAVYNVINGSGPQNTFNFPVLIIHFIVMAMCITFIALIIKSLFKVTYVQHEESALFTADDNSISFGEVRLRKV